MFSFLPSRLGLRDLIEKLKTLPEQGQYRKFFKILGRREKKAFFIFLVLGLVSSAFLTVNFYFKHTEVRAAAGGEFTEGMIGQPRFINPIFAPANDIDRDLTELIFSGLMKYSVDGQIQPDLAKGYQVSQDGQTWEINLKENLVFQDGSPLTSDDVIFTIKTIQNPDYKSPLRPSWLGIETERVSDLTVRFKLKNVYPGFLESLTLKIIPKKTWEEITAENFPLAIFNLKPVGSGPYRVARIIQEKDQSGRIKSLTLEINPRYHAELPKIKEITFAFFEQEKDLIEAAQNREIQALVLSAPEKQLLFENRDFVIHHFDLPRYFAVFFNQKNALVLAEKNVRLALNYAVNKKEIIDQVLGNSGVAVDSPILPDLFGFEEPQITYRFSPNKARDLLEKAGFKLNPQTNVWEKTVEKKLSFEFKNTLSKSSQGAEVKELQKCLARDPGIYPEGEITGVFGPKTREAVIKFQEKYRADILTPAGLISGNGETGPLTRQKLNKICFGPNQQTLALKFSLVTVDDPVLLKTAEILKKQWAEIGAKVEIRSFSFSQLNSDFLKPREYDALLFGEVLGQIPDLFPFWHSLQKKDPGLNLALYENKEADKFLEEARQTNDEGVRKEKLEKFQEILLADAPAVFLYRPDFVYLTSPEIRGIKAGLIADPSQRFEDIQNWYLATKRVWKP